tara:strand:- start:78 stop:1058 length:981 start_codon:yes stop_codon:yes gene_type:complete
MNKTMKFLVNEINSGERIDIYLSKKINFLTRSFIKKLIEKNGVLLNKKKTQTSSIKVKVNDEVLIDIIKEKKDRILPKKMNLDIIFEDKDIIVLNKSKGVVVHPGAGNFENTLVNGLIYKYKKQLSDVNGEIRPGIIHRIDKDTSGLLVVAKNNISHSKLAKQFSDHSIKRKYQCLIWGVVRPLKGKIISLIARSKKNRQLMTVSEINGKKAITNYKTIKVFNVKDIPKISLIECELETGRTHQIRVHLKYKGASIIGDNQYGKKNIKFKKIDKNFSKILSNVNGQILHAATLGFVHPTKKKWLNFEASLPTEFKKMLNLLNKLDG